MKNVLKGISYIALLGTFVPAILIWAGTIQLETHKMIMIIAMVLWFITAPFCMKK